MMSVLRPLEGGRFQCLVLSGRFRYAITLSFPLDGPLELNDTPVVKCDMVPLQANVD